MKPPPASKLLTVWEKGVRQPPAARALIILAAASPDTSAEELAQLPVGRRDARLLELREAMFGLTLHCLARCAKCDDLLEIEFPARGLAVEDAGAPASCEGVQQVEVEEFEVRFRLPNSSDLLHLHNVPLAEAKRQLLARCIVQASVGDREVGFEDLPQHLIAAIALRMAESDPQADVQLNLSCPACGHCWQAAFDIVSHLWTEIEVYARRLLREIHVLASTYGWREADILALSAARRAVYLEFCKT